MIESKRVPRRSNTLLCLVIVTPDQRYWTGRGWTKHVRKAKKFPLPDPGLRYIGHIAGTIARQTGEDCVPVFVPT